MSAMLKVTLVKSMNGRPERHREILRGLGLRKLNRSIQLADTSANRGMVNKVLHLVKIEENTDEA
ncbi:MAG: 50S ribosomal protein L30 [Desulfobacteraceae bacterium]|nr:MAG: 50S ribosomal protein L30 [Desulfobacteraceae bacterium]